MNRINKHISEENFAKSISIGLMDMDFMMRNETFARELYARWESFSKQHIERVADEVFQKFHKDNEIIEIDRLEIDLGKISENNFDRQFAYRFREQLETVLLQYLSNPNHKHRVRKRTFSENYFEILCRFLLTGWIDQNIPKKYHNIAALFYLVLTEESQRLRAFLQTYGHYTSLQQRLIYQLEDKNLEDIVALVNPQDSSFICSYVRLLVTKYKQIEQPQLTQSQHRNAVWLVVIAYLLEADTSYFNKKEFVTHTIMRLAGTYNTGYEQLLNLLTYKLESVAKQLQIPPELFKMLLELQTALSEANFQTTLVDVVKFYKSIASIFDDDVQTELPENNRSALIDILSRVDSCRLFLQQLKESEIIQMVRIVIPNDSEFVLGTAQTLEKQVNTNSKQKPKNLQGKIGGEFRLLKWQIIFPVLFENKGVAFNKSHFVRRVLQDISAHYNLTLTDILLFILHSDVNVFLSKELSDIITHLYNIENQTSEQVQKTRKVRPQTIFNDIKSNKILTENQRQKILVELQHDPFPKNILAAFATEEERYQLIRKIAPAESDFIIDYAKALDKQSNGMPEGKNFSGFRDLKWLFIFSVMSERNGIAFNRKYFVASVIRRIAAHFNLNYVELLLYFANLKNAILKNQFKEIQTILSALAKEQKLSNTSTPKLNSMKPKTPTDTDQFFAEMPSVLYVQNSGLVLLAAYLGKLFNRLDYTEDGAFKQPEDQIRAVLLLQYAVQGNEKPVQENELLLNKLFAGLDVKTPIPTDIALRQEEKEMMDELLTAVLQNWGKLKNTSTQGLREAFIQRTGKLEEKTDCDLLTVEEKAYDILLDSCPWNFRTIRLPWMERGVWVKWR